MINQQVMATTQTRTNGRFLMTLGNLEIRLNKIFKHLQKKNRNVSYLAYIIVHELNPLFEIPF